MHRPDHLNTYMSLAQNAATVKKEKDKDRNLHCRLLNMCTEPIQAKLDILKGINGICRKVVTDYLSQVSLSHKEFHVNAATSSEHDCWKSIYQAGLAARHRMQVPDLVAGEREREAERGFNSMSRIACGYMMQDLARHRQAVEQRAETAPTTQPVSDLYVPVSLSLALLRTANRVCLGVVTGTCTWEPNPTPIRRAMLLRDQEREKNGSVALGGAYGFAYGMADTQMSVCAAEVRSTVSGGVCRLSGSTQHIGAYINAHNVPLLVRAHQLTSMFGLHCIALQNN
ncbi:hypothetical protein KIPB_010272 [Kipferlia bialata]|uniref:Uncharacterized protein n=1 Tax=Kipferlia bialata TaxID=797122 RepID=A0A9K3D460_9EUKA|nr:hypothetical protein KIPB_010272 [Kipferlia bialata]|eukprot:g10272.t1